MGGPLQAKGKNRFLKMDLKVELSIIVVNFNRPDLTLNCLNSIYQNPPAGNYEIILVDNGSTDRGAAGIKERFPDVKFLTFEQNVGFSRANNSGAKNSTGGLLLFLNNDTQVLAGSLQAMVRFLLENQEAAAVGGRLENESGQPDISCARFPSPRTEFWPALGLDKFFKTRPFFNAYYLNYLPITQPVAVEVITGADLMVKREVFEELGGFDEKFFFYYEDTDFCLRIKKAGYKIFWLPRARIIHQRGATIGPEAEKKFLQWRASRLYFYRKNYPRQVFNSVRKFMLLTIFLRFLIFPVFLLGRWFGIKKNLEDYRIYVKAWRLVKNFK